MPNPFPSIELEMLNFGGEDRNPAIQVFGRRFFSDQTNTELLVELLLVAVSQKKIKRDSFNSILPAFEVLHNWPSNERNLNYASLLEYAPKARLNLKLFSFLGASKLETRHETHRKHYKDLLTHLSEQITIAGLSDKNDVLKTLENLFLGFQGVGGQRTWCAQAFLPITKTFIASETIWNETEANRILISDWDDIISYFKKYFSVNRHRFLARGGELLYLQLCNALRQDFSTIKDWADKSDFGFNEIEIEPERLYVALSRAISDLMNVCPKTIEKLAEFIDSGVDSETALRTDTNEAGSARFTSCGWCPEESWQEGYLFAVEVLRLCSAQIDPMERFELLEILCAMQVIRSLCAQSARYMVGEGPRKNIAEPLGYLFAISDPEGSHKALTQISRRSVSACERMINDAIRNTHVKMNVDEQQRLDIANGRKIQNIYKEADSRYGYKYFLSICKRIGMIIPRRGKGARFIINEKILKLLILTVMRPGQRITYETFKRLVKLHYGMMFDDKDINMASQWSGGPPILTLGGNADVWLLEMLDAAGVLIRLSDSCTLIVNPSDAIEEAR